MDLRKAAEEWDWIRLPQPATLQEALALAEERMKVLCRLSDEAGLQGNTEDQVYYAGEQSGMKQLLELLEKFHSPKPE